MPGIRHILTRALVSIVAASIFALILGAVLASPAVAGDGVRERVRAYTNVHRRDIVGELVDLLKLPNVATNPEDIEQNLRHLTELLERRGITTQVLRSEAGAPALYGQLDVPGAIRTVVFYAHYDGQPVNPDRWASPPWTPVLRDGPLDAGGGEVALDTLEEGPSDEARLYARSASDDKGPIVALLTALDALRALEVSPSVNLKFFFEGEEEAGSPHLGEILRRHADLLAADLWIFCDGPVHQSRRQQLVFGVRGVVPLELTVYGALKPLHSGHYGNWAPNPIALLSELLAGLRTAEGDVLVKGFYDDVRPPTELERRVLAALPDIESDLLRELGLARSEGGGRLSDRISMPALNLRGVHSGAVGEKAKNAIPITASASIDFRLVPDLNPERVRELVEAHLEGQGYFLVHGEPDLAVRHSQPKIVRLAWGGGYPAARTSLDHPAAQAVVTIAKNALGGAVIQVPTLGGSLPLYLFQEILRAPFVVVPMVNHDNNQHAPNENLRLANLWDGIDLYAVLMAELGQQWQVGIR